MEKSAQRLFTSIYAATYSYVCVCVSFCICLRTFPVQRGRSDAFAYWLQPVSFCCFALTLEFIHRHRHKHSHGKSVVSLTFDFLHCLQPSSLSTYMCVCVCLCMGAGGVVAAMIKSVADVFKLPSEMYLIFVET